MLGSDTIIAHVEVRLCGIEPPVQRTLELPFDLTLGELHHVLQGAFGWSDAHLHRFRIGGLDYAPADPEDEDAPRRVFDSHAVRLMDFSIAFGERTHFIYEYDFGARWVVDISLGLAEHQSHVTYPRCRAGSRSGPPEDSGGAEAYVNSAAAWGDPDHRDHAEVRQWMPPGFDPERFDVVATTELIRLRLRAA